MAKIMVFQHVAHEPLGLLDSLIKERKHRIRYVNFGRDTESIPNIENYDGLIVLGGPMNIGEEKQYPHLETEKQVILQAIERDLPLLGICLGAQLIASALGANVYEGKVKEVGWYPVSMTKKGAADPLFQSFNQQESVFQWHQFTFDLPKNAELLVEGESITNQAFRYKNNVYGFQFHLETDLAMIKRWLTLPEHIEEFNQDKNKKNNAPQPDEIWRQSQTEISTALALGHNVFSGFLDLFPDNNVSYLLPHKH